MKTYLSIAGVGLVLAVALGVAVAAEPLKSGPQVGEKVPGPFHPLNVTGPNAGEKFCLYCKSGDNPVAMIFAREVSAPLTKLIKEIDATTGKNQSREMGSFVVFLSDDEGLEKQLKEVAQKEKIGHIVLSIDHRAGPPKYNVAKDADITVVLYKERTVMANRAFKKGDLKDKDVEQVVADIKKIVPEK